MSKVSIITIVFNSEKTIIDTIESVLNQTYPNIEYIIVDGGSSDNSIEIIKGYGDRLKWVSEQDRGIADAFNKGIALATGDIIGIINSDDWYDTDAISTIVKELTLEDAVYCGNIRLIASDNSVLRIKKSRVGMIQLGMYIMHPSVFIKTAVYDRVGLFDISFKIAMDFDMMLRIKKAGYSIKYIDKVIANMRVDGVSGNVSLMHNEEIRTIRAHLSGLAFVKSALFHFLNRTLFFVKTLLASK